MVQESYSFFWDEARVHERLDQKLTKAYHTVQEAVKEKGVHPRLAAMVVGVARVAEACKLRGWVWRGDGGRGGTASASPSVADGDQTTP